MSRSHIRSAWPTAAHPLGLLTDRKIDAYKRRGIYGTAAQARQQSIDARRRPSSRRIPKYDVDSI